MCRVVCENKHVIIAKPRNSDINEQRKNLRRLVSKLRKHPLDLLPERSADCLNQFFAGYGIFGPPVWRDLASFERWLTDRLFYPKDTGARWWRFIQLNSKDYCDGYELFCRLYRQYSRGAPIDIQPTAPDHLFDPRQFDFYLHLYAIGRRPSMYLGSGDRVQLIAAYLAGYFRGKKDARITLTRDEKEFLRFEDWLSRDFKPLKQYPWYRVVEMWPYSGLNSFEWFLAYFDAYLTNYGKKPRGLDDLFEVVKEKVGTSFRRRRKLPKKVVRFQEPKVWWRSPWNKR